MRAILFPGQGSQHQDMLSTYIDNKIFRNTIIEASEALGYDIIETVKDQSKLNNTLYTQPILVATSTAMWRVWKDKCNIAPSFAAGHSLGEYSALVANGFIGFSVFYMFIGYIYYNLVRKCFQKINTNIRIDIILMLFVLTGYLVISLFSFPKERIFHQVFLSLFLAYSIYSFVILFITFLGACSILKCSKEVKPYSKDGVTNKNKIV